MAPSEYAVSGGGRLKIKGSKVQDGRVDKKKKKKKKEKEKEGGDATVRTEEEDTRESAGEAASLKEKDDQDRRVGELVSDDGKTAAERRYAEAKRKRVRITSTTTPTPYYLEQGWLTLLKLNERLKREGVKTHKERVEELNKYLSNLSEHHDMPRIGPG
ncbi:uncharacterized protein GIQ15_00293 [Arthroderma uncinatum]|uniref:uncharacterized protein n=1 Tax=Arthroderma uncinatum TaxID=74035 RepID=UPI00144A5C9C|nr:uncharacterized protein GIQ15_00293 [Arthroderma uncinatum]KAF3490776.1 hypothetical protein GIQ15_00293 [Arthroderma uncinatum]